MMNSVRLPNPADVVAYRNSVPDEFRFTIKVPNSTTLTHFYKKAKTAPLVTNPYFLSPFLFQTFLSLLDPLQDVLGPLMFQFEYLNRQKMKSRSHFQELFEEFIFPYQLSIAEHFIQWSNPFALLFGLNGVILLAYIIAIPANEIVIPTILMLTVVSAGMSGVGEGAGVMFEPGESTTAAVILQAGGWTTMTAVNVMLFSLLHNPCSTTIYTIFKETRNWRWTALAAVLPLVMGFVVVFAVTQVWTMVTAAL